MALRCVALHCIALYCIAGQRRTVRRDDRNERAAVSRVHDGRLPSERDRHITRDQRERDVLSRAQLLAVRGARGGAAVRRSGARQRLLRQQPGGDLVQGRTGAGDQDMVGAGTLRREEELAVESLRRQLAVHAEVRQARMNDYAYTVEPRFMVTSLVRSPLHYGHH